MNRFTLILGCLGHLIATGEVSILARESSILGVAFIADKMGDSSPPFPIKWISTNDFSLYIISIFLLFPLVIPLLLLFSEKVRCYGVELIFFYITSSFVLLISIVFLIAIPVSQALHIQLFPFA